MIGALPADDFDNRRSRLIPWEFLPEAEAPTPDFCIESDPEGWHRSRREMLPAVRFLASLGAQFIVKFSGNRSLHLIIPHEALPPGGYAIHLALCRALRRQGGLGCYVHLLREYSAPFALHRVTGLAALPLLPDQVEGFRPWQASVDQVRVPDWWPPCDPKGLARTRQVLGELISSGRVPSSARATTSPSNLDPPKPAPLSSAEANELWATASGSAPAGERWLAVEELLCGMESESEAPGDALTRLLLDDEEMTRAAAAALCLRLGARSVPALVAALEQATTWRGLRNVICLAQELGLEGELAPQIEAARERVLVPSVAGTIKYHDWDDLGRSAVLRRDAEDRTRSPEARARVLHVIGVAGLESAKGIIVQGLEDPSPIVRQTAAQALGVLGESADAPYLGRIQNDPEPGVCCWRSWAEVRLKGSSQGAADPRLGGKPGQVAQGTRVVGDQVPGQLSATGTAVDAGREADTGVRNVVLHWVSAVTAAHSFGVVSRSYIGALRSLGARVAVTDAPLPGYEPSIDFPLAGDDVGGPGVPALRIAVCHNHPDLVAPVPGASYSIGYVPLHSPLWGPGRDAVLRMDEVWVPSSFSRALCLDAGLPAAGVRVMPLGVDTVRFRPAPGSGRERRERPFTFLALGSASLRKGWPFLLRAYLEAFSAGDDVLLHIKASPGPDLARWLPVLGRYDRRSAPRVWLEVGGIDDDSLPGLYQGADAFVLPSMSESWGLVFAEAMASGIPVITTRWGGQLDFLGDGHAYLVSVERLVSPDLPDAASPGGWPAVYAVPSTDHLAELMRHVYEHQDEARAKGAAAREWISAHWTWKHGAVRILERLAAILREGRTDRPPEGAVGA
jgi:glycosyltransferase involved in cell wall biosynthesis/HEAT repeat protein